MERTSNMCKQHLEQQQHRLPIKENNWCVEDNNLGSADVCRRHKDTERQVMTHHKNRDVRNKSALEIDRQIVEQRKTTWKWVAIRWSTNLGQRTRIKTLWAQLRRTGASIQNSINTETHKSMHYGITKPLKISANEHTPYFRTKPTVTRVTNRDKLWAWGRSVGHRTGARTQNNTSSVTLLNKTISTTVSSWRWTNTQIKDRHKQAQHKWGTNYDPHIPDRSLACRAKPKGFAP